MGWRVLCTDSTEASSKGLWWEASEAGASAHLGVWALVKGRSNMHQRPVLACCLQLSLMHKIESRFRFLAADPASLLRGTRPSYRAALEAIRDRWARRETVGRCTRAVKRRKGYRRDVEHDKPRRCMPSKCWAKGGLPNVMYPAGSEEERSHTVCLEVK